MKTLQHLMTEYADLKKERDALITEHSQYTPNQFLDMNANRVLQREHEERWKKFYTDKYEPQLQELREEGRDVAARIKAEGDRNRPKLDGDSPAALMRTEQAWRNTVLPLLEKGVPLREALRNADVDAVLGAERFAPGYFGAKNYNTDSGVAGMQAKFGDDRRMTMENVRADDGSSITRHILERFADMDPANADSLTMAARADADLDSFNHYVVTHDRSGGGLDAALVRHYADQGTPEAREKAAQTAQERAAAMGATHVEV
nr:hypothetical protein [uncultured Rhodococcus sp.]